MASINKQQKEKIKSLQLKIQDLIETNSEFQNEEEVSRWLKARQWKVDEAEEMLRNHIKWKKDFDLENFYETYKPPEVKFHSILLLRLKRSNQ